MGNQTIKLYMMLGPYKAIKHKAASFNLVIIQQMTKNCGRNQVFLFSDKLCKLTSPFNNVGFQHSTFSSKHLS